MIIQGKVRSLFDNLSAVDAHQKVPSFAVSDGWFERFKWRHGFHSLSSGVKISGA
jgi:hypothetical protein